MDKKLMIAIAKLKKQIDAFEEEFKFNNFKKDYDKNSKSKKEDLKKDVLKQIKNDQLEESDIIKIINLAKSNNDLYFVYEIGKLLKDNDTKALQAVTFYLNKYGNEDLLKKLIKSGNIRKDFAIEVIGGYEEITYLQGDEADTYIGYFEEGKKGKLFSSLTEFDYGDGGEWFFEDEIRPRGYDFLSNSNYAVVCNTKLGDIGFYKVIKGIGLKGNPTK